MWKNKEAISLFFADWKGYESIVQILLNNWEDIDLWKKNGASPLFIAWENGHNSTVQILLSNGGDGD